MLTIVWEDVNELVANSKFIVFVITLQFDIVKFNPIWSSSLALPLNILIIYGFFLCLFHNLHTLGLHTESYWTNLGKIFLIGHRLVKYLDVLCKWQVQVSLMEKLLSCQIFTKFSL